ncbi:glycosyl transferase [Cryptosporidium andersoni]|uniref:Dolichol-phosphate mannosyltransferase subunit 1 n=1 Tax=Cryptosporidium andersoni TaxID=117008 RepID=A0A1J4MVM7_9CRYT|nr:glycosyl transferase [Cryptosporidium andersoni]
MEKEKHKVDYTVIIPTYNERQNVGILVKLLFESFSELRTTWELIIVDDSSPDGTADAVQQLQEYYKEVQMKLISREGKLGLGSAYIEGFKHSNGEFIILMDCDLSHHPKYIPQLIAKQNQGDFDIVSGSRYIHGGGISGWPWYRVLISYGANMLGRILLQPKATDLTGSFRLYRRHVFKRILEYNMMSKGYAFQMEIIVLATRLGYSVADVPILFVNRLYGTSKLGKNEIWGYIKGLVKLFWTF